MKVEKERSSRKKRTMGKTKQKIWMDAQVLLLMDPGAELGWVVLSDTLPSAGGRKEVHVKKGQV